MGHCVCAIDAEDNVELSLSDAPHCASQTELFIFSRKLEFRVTSVVSREAVNASRISI